MKNVLLISVLIIFCSCNRMTDQEKANKAIEHSFERIENYLEYYPLSSGTVKEIKSGYLQTFEIDTMSIDSVKITYYESNYMMEHKFRLYDKVAKKGEEINTIFLFNKNLDKVTGVIEDGKYIPTPHFE